MTPTPYEYHTDSKLHGSYQYTKLSDVIKSFVRESMDDDSLIKNTKRYRIVESAKEGLRELNLNGLGDVRSIQFTVPENPNFVLPNDFVKYVRISVLELDKNNGNWELHPLNINRNINTAVSYLQDHNKEIIFDGNGNILAADHLNTFHRPYVKYGFVNGKYTSKTSEYGDFKIDRGHIYFSSNMSEKEVVMEYISDGLTKSIFEEEEINVHKNIVQVLKDWIYYDLIKYKRNVPQNRINGALLRFKTTRHEAKVEAMKFSLVDIQRTARL